MPAPILRYQAQLQEQQQEVPAATPPAAATTGGTPPPAADSVDSIIGDILKSKPEPAGDEEPDAEPADPSDSGEGDDAGEADAGDPDDADDADDAPADDAAEEDDAAEAPEPDAAALKAARKALKDGDLDKAFQLAFGKKPEEIYPTDKVWTAWRKANERKDQAVAAERQAVAVQLQQGQTWVAQQRQQLQGVIEQLKPYDVYYQLEQQFARDGDYSALVKMVEHAAKMPYDEAQKLILTRTRRSPGERQLQQQVQTLMQKLEEAERKKTEEASQQTQQQVYQSDLDTIRGQLSGEVTRVPRFAERVYNVLLKTKGPTGLTLTPEQAGQRVLAAERRKLARHPLLKKPKAASPVSQAASTLAKAKKGKTATTPALRRDSRGNGATDEKTETVDDIIGDILKKPGTVRRVAR